MSAPAKGKRRRVSARKWVGSDRRLEPGDASHYIKWAPDVIAKGTKVVIAARVSTGQQNRRQNLADQVGHLSRWVADSGALVVGDPVEHVGSGADPSWLPGAALLARQHGAVILAESVDRLIRNPDFNPKTCPDAQPREADLEELRVWTDGVILATLIHPNATPAEIRSFQRRRGQEAKGHRGGRPRKRRWKERRLARIDLARRMRDDGWSCRQIADWLNARDDGFRPQTAMTVYNWLRRGI